MKFILILIQIACSGETFNSDKHEIRLPRTGGNPRTVPDLSVERKYKISSGPFASRVATKTKLFQKDRFKTKTIIWFVENRIKYHWKREQSWFKMLPMSKILAFHHKRGHYNLNCSLGSVVHCGPTVEPFFWVRESYPGVDLRSILIEKVQTLEKNFPGWTIFSIDSEPVKAQSLIDIGECYGHCRADNNE